MRTKSVKFRCQMSSPLGPVFGVGEAGRGSSRVKEKIYLLSTLYQTKVQELRGFKSRALQPSWCH